MKYSGILLLFFGWMAFTSCGEGNSDNNERDSENEAAAEVAVNYVANTEVEMEIEGMMCSMGCKGAIEKELNHTQGVAECVVDFENGTALVKYDDSFISQQELIETVNQVNDGAYQAVLATEAKVETENSEV